MGTPSGDDRAAVRLPDVHAFASALQNALQTVSEIAQMEPEVDALGFTTDPSPSPETIAHIDCSALCVSAMGDDLPSIAGIYTAPTLAETDDH